MVKFKVMACPSEGCGRTQAPQPTSSMVLEEHRLLPQRGISQRILRLRNQELVAYFIASFLCDFFYLIVTLGT